MPDNVTRLYPSKQEDEELDRTVAIQYAVAAMARRAGIHVPDQEEGPVYYEPEDKHKVTIKIETGDVDPEIMALYNRLRTMRVAEKFFLGVGLNGYLEVFFFPSPQVLEALVAAGKKILSSR